MELDFTGLEKLGRRSPQDNTQAGSLGSPEGIGKLQGEIDERKAQLDRALKVYSEYQENIRAAAQLLAEILKGAKSGESIYRLFLKAAEAIARMTSDSLFYSQLREDIASIYGAGLLEPDPLEIDLKATQERLQRLREAEGRNPLDRNIQAAVKAHEQKAEQLQALIKK